jgi:Domain of unknown function (DUF1707)/Cell wall-active antibiotics response 4TMS YvqF
MSNPLEPSDVGPVVGGDLIAADVDRDHVVTLLNAAHAEGRVTAAERDQRIAAARTAETFDDLVPLTRDLVGPAGARPAVSYDEANGSVSADQIVAIFAGASRKHAWRVRKHTSILTVFGGAELDLTQATFESRDVEINVFCLFGGIELTVPPGTDVDNQVMAVLGGIEVGKLAAPDPSAPRITVKGFVGFGGVEIKNPKVRKFRG